MLNKTIIMGRITHDLELKTTPAGKEVVSFNVAVDRDFSKEEKQTDFFTVVAWGGTASFICRYFGKGRLIAVDGRLQTRSWTNNNGEKRYATEIIANNVYFGGDKPNSANDSFGSFTNKAESMGIDVEYEDDNSDDLPFDW